jgi:hypothetical protein
MPNEGVSYRFCFLCQLYRKLRYDIKRTTVQLLKAIVVTPWLKACKKYYGAVHIFVVTL